MSNNSGNGSNRRDISKSQHEWEGLLRSPTKRFVPAPGSSQREDTATFTWQTTSPRRGRKKRESSSDKWKEMRKEIPSYLLNSPTKLQMDKKPSFRQDDDDAMDMSMLLNERTGKIAELCEADKSKLAKLVQELVKLGSERDHYMHELEKDKAEYEGRLSKLKEQNEEIIGETIELKTKFSHSLEMLRVYQTRLVSMQKAHDKERQNRITADEQLHKMQENNTFLEKKVKKQSAELQVKEAQQKREFTDRVSLIEKELFDVNENLKEERKRRVHEQKILTQKLSNRTEQFESYKAVEVQENTDVVPKNVQTLLDSWADRLKDALKTSYLEESAVQESSQASVLEQLFEDIQPMQHTTPSLFSMSELKPRKRTAAPTTTGHPVKRFDSLLVSAGSDPGRSTTSKVVKPKTAPKTRTPTKQRTPTRTTKSQGGTRPKSAAVPHTRSQGSLSASRSSEMSLFDIVRDLEGEQSNVPKSTQYGPQHSGRRATPRSQGPLSATELEDVAEIIDITR